MNAQTFKDGMKLLTATWPDRSPSKETNAAYWMALLDLDDDVFTAAIKRVLRRATFFPAPAELRAAAEEAMTEMGIAPPEPERAWELVARKASRLSLRACDEALLEHPSIKRTVSEVGGYHGIGMSERGDMPFVRKRFIDRYAVYRRRQLDGEMGWFAGEVAQVADGAQPIGSLGAGEDAS